MDVSFHFSEECYVAFNKQKEALTTAPILHPLICRELFKLMCDASSNKAIGIVLGKCLLIRSPMSLIMLVTL